MKTDHSSAGQISESPKDGFRLTISEKAFIALLNAIVFLMVIATQGQNVMDVMQAPISSLAHQNHLP